MAEAALFVLGLYLSVRVVAALFRIVDLWYRIGDQWPRVSRGIAAWGGIAAAIALTLDGRRRTAFLCGLAAYVVIHVLVYVSTQVYVWMQYRSRRRA